MKTTTKKAVLMTDWGLFLLASSATWAEKHPFSNGLYWELENGVLTISGNGATGNFLGLSPWSPWYKNKGMIEKVVIQNGVTALGEHIFDHHQSLTCVSIPNSVTSIGDYALTECSSLTTVSIPNSVECIGKSAFLVCSSLTTVNVPNSVKSIGEGAFRICCSLLG